MPFRIFRLSNMQKDADAEHLKSAREHVTAAREMLGSSPQPDTFAGRKTQEPFPGGDDDLEGWVNSRELRPPQ